MLTVEYLSSSRRVSVFLEADCPRSSVSRQCSLLSNKDSLSVGVTRRDRPLAAAQVCFLARSALMRMFSTGGTGTSCRTPGGNQVKYLNHKQCNLFPVNLKSITKLRTIKKKTHTLIKADDYFRDSNDAYT